MKNYKDMWLDEKEELKEKEKIFSNVFYNNGRKSTTDTKEKRIPKAIPIEEQSKKSGIPKEI